jgi:hypothetical protein
MKFDDVTAEAIQHGVKYYEMGSPVDGYTVQRADGVYAVMHRRERNLWSLTMPAGAYSTRLNFLGSKARMAEKALDLVANADPAQ